MPFTLSMIKILNHLRPGEAWVIRGDDTVYANLEWLDVTVKPTEQAMLDDEIAAAKSHRINTIKEEAKERILAAVPQWRQNNIGRGVYDETTTPTLSSLNSSIDTIRTDSDTAEASVNALTDVQAIMDFTW